MYLKCMHCKVLPSKNKDIRHALVYDIVVLVCCLPSPKSLYIMDKYYK